jgi:hypothetical protein
MAALDFDPFTVTPKPGVAPADVDPFTNGTAPSTSIPEAAPTSSFGHKAALVGSSLLSGAEQGVGSLLDLGRATVNSMLHPFNFSEEAAEKSGLMPDPSITNALMAPGDAAHLTGPSGPQPQGTGEGLLAAGARGLGSAIPFALAGQPLAALGSGAAGGAAGEAAKDLGAPGWAQTGAGILAGLGVGGVANVATNISKASAAAEAVTSAQRELSAAQAAVDAAKANNPLALGSARADLASAKDAATNAVATARTASEAARDATTNAAQTTIADSKSALDKTLALHDSVGAVSEAARDAQIAAGAQTASDASRAADSSIESIAAAHGTSSTLQDAGEKLQNSARSWLTKDLPAKQASAWAPVDAAVSETTPTPLYNLNSALKDINTSAGTLEPIAKLLKPGLPAQVQRVFNDVLDTPEGVGAKSAVTGKSPILDEFGTPLTKELSPAVAGKPVTWEDVQKLRSTLGDAMSNPQTIKDVGAQNLSRLYASITADMATTARAKGASDLFDSANAESTRLYGVAEGPIAKVVSGPKASLADDPAPGKVASGLLASGRSGNTDLEALRTEGLPVGELTAAQLREDPSAWSKLSPEAQQTLVPDSAHRATLDSALAAKSGESEAVKASSAAANATHQAELDRLSEASQVAKDAHAQTVAQTQASIATANAAHRATMETAKENVKFGPRTAAARVGDLSQSQAAEGVAQAQALREAKAKLSETTNPLVQGKEKGPLHSLVGANVGGELGMLLGHVVDASGLSPLEHGAVGALIGAGAPMAYRGARNLITNPGALRDPLIGGYAGNTRQ